MDQFPPRSDHPILDCADRVHAARDDALAADPVLMTTAQKAEALLELSRAADRVHGLLLRVLAESDDVAQDAGARSPAAWLAHRTRSSHGTAVGAGRVADALEHRWHLVREGVLAGTVNLEQARVLTRALDDLPADLDPDVRRRAEAYLVEQAATFDPRRLRILGRKVLEVVAPEVAEDHERRALEDEERRARRTTRLTFRRRGDGTTEIHARVADTVAGRLRTYLEAFANPRRDRPAAPGPEPSPDPSARRVPHEVRLGRAFCALLEALPAKVLPRQGGSATTLVVTIPLDQLRRQVGAAAVGAGVEGPERLSATEALRLACTARIVPAVLGGRAQPLHLGRARRLFSDAQRLAMAVRDGACRAEGCDIPADWCEAHHVRRPWAGGGLTDVEDGVLLCSFHHHRAHDPDYTADLRSGRLRFSRRARVG
jgi:hypothetical protein